jgi:ABC-2 type transport system ATP-binding protein
MSVAEKMCDSIVMIFKGRKVLDGSLNAIRTQYGADTIRVRLVGGVPVPAGIDGVDSIVDFGQYQELRCRANIDAQRVLAQVMQAGAIELFEIAHPSLQDIFVRIAAPGAEAMAGAA